MNLRLRRRARREAERVRLVSLLSEPREIDDEGVPIDVRSARGGWLAGADLRGADLRHVDLSWTNLSGADLRGADLRYAQLAHAMLVEADLRNAKLDHADLSWANLSEARCGRSSFERAIVVEATFHGADLAGIDFRSVTGLTDGCLKAVRIDGSTQWPVGFDPSDPRVGGPVIHRLPGRK